MVFETGVETPVYLAFESYSARTNAETPGWEEYYNTFGNLSGFFSDCLNDYANSKLDRENSLRLTIPQSEKEMRTGQRTNANQFKWIYDIKLTRASVNDRPTSAGSVAAPTYTAEIDGNTLTLTFTAEEGATIYHSFNGDTETSAAQYQNTDLIVIDITGKDLAASPVTFKLHAVKLSYADADEVSFTYPTASPATTNTTNVVIGTDVTITKGSAVTDDAWSAWTSAITEIAVAPPSAINNTYTKLDSDKYSIDDTTKTISISKDAFTYRGTSRIQISASGYQNKSVSPNLYGVMPVITPDKEYVIGEAIVLTFDDQYYINSTSGYQFATVTADGTSVPNTYLTRDTKGYLAIKNTYFNYASCKLNTVGAHTLVITNSNYYPATQTITLTMVTERTPETPPEEPPELEFTASADSSEKTVGTPFTVTLNLTSDKAFDLYGAQLSMKLEAGKFDIGTVSKETGWSSETKLNENGYDYVTFAFLDQNGVSASEVNSVSTVQLTPKASGSARYPSLTQMLRARARTIRA